ncbi:MAG TPA: hypothetical protein DDY49_07440 [Paenibacillaceae bacterium]|nr:hypothetical protein [Paenibacillaceae bacterium]
MSILDWVILFLLVLGLGIGFKQGLMIQLVKLITFIASFGIAILFYKPLSQQLAQWFPLSQESGANLFSSIAGSEPIAGVIYSSVSFVLLLIVSGILLRFIGSILNGIADLPVISTINHLGGGLLGITKNGLLVFLLLMIAYALPIPSVQQTIHESVLGTYAVEISPGILQFFQGLIQHTPTEMPMGNSTKF